MSIQTIIAIALAWVLSLGGVAGTAYHYGGKNMHNADIAEASKAKAAADAAQAKLRGELQDLARNAFRDHEAMDRQLAEERAKKRVVTKTIREEVPVYVTAQANRVCSLTDGFVQLHDAAAAGSPIVGPATGTDANGSWLVDRPSGVPVTQAAEVIADNYATAHEWESLVKGLRARIRELEGFYDQLKEKVHVCN